MTVDELIKKLQRLPPGHRVVVDRYSDYADCLTVKLMVVEPQQQGEYFTEVKPKDMKPELLGKAHGAVYIGRDSF